MYSMKVYTQKSCFVLVAISMLYAVFPVSRVDAKTAGSATANMVQVPFPKSVNPVKVSQYSAAYAAVPSVNCRGMSIRACEAAQAQERAQAAAAQAAQARATQAAAEQRQAAAAQAQERAQAAAAQAAQARAAQAAAAQAAQARAAQAAAEQRQAAAAQAQAQAQAAAAQAAAEQRQTPVVRPVTTTVPVATNTNTNPDTNCNKTHKNPTMENLCKTSYNTDNYSKENLMNLGIVHNFPSNSAKICTARQTEDSADKDCLTNAATRDQIAISAATLNSAINDSKDTGKTTVVYFEGFNTAAASGATNNKENATTRAISSAAQACNNSNPPAYTALNKDRVIERTTDKCAMFYISADVTPDQQKKIEAKCIAAAIATNVACAIARPRQDTTDNNFNKAGFRATTASVKTIYDPLIDVCSRATRTLIQIERSNYSDALHYRPTNGACDTSPPPPPPIDVCSRATRTLIQIERSNYSDALHYMPVDDRCDTSPPPLDNNPGGNSDTPGGRNDGPGGRNDGPGGRNDGPGGPNDGPGGPNDTPDYSDWPDYTLDPETGEPWVVEVRVDTIAPTYYVANGKKTSLSHTVQVLCGVNKEICTEDTHGIVYTSPKITATQSSTALNFVACASPKETKCAYYAPKNEQVVILNNGNTTGFDIYFYTPLPVTTSALTTLAVDITVNRIIEFDDGSSELVNVDDVERRFYINGNPSSNTVSRKVLGSRG